MDYRRAGDGRLRVAIAALRSHDSGEGETVERLEDVWPAVERAFTAGVRYCRNVKIRGVRSPFTEWQIAGKKM